MHVKQQHSISILYLIRRRQLIGTARWPEDGGWCKCTRGGAAAHSKGNDDCGGSGSAVARRDRLGRYGRCDDVVLWICWSFVESDLK